MASNRLSDFIIIDKDTMKSLFIGKFFRNKSTAVQSMIDRHIYNAFADGYNSAAAKQLPPDWLKLAHICDIDSMLGLINRQNIPKEWITDIEQDILTAIYDRY